MDFVLTVGLPLLVVFVFEVVFFLVLALAQYAARPLTAGLILALVIALFMKETYPRSP